MRVMPHRGAKWIFRRNGCFTPGVDRAPITALLRQSRSFTADMRGLRREARRVASRLLVVKSMSKQRYTDSLRGV